MKLQRAVRFLAFALLLLAIPAALSSTSSAQIGIGIGISVQIGPPALPVYEQPICPSPGFLWAPGYWAWSDDAGYYWVPGTWVEPPTVGLLWTPGYWGWNNGAYVWNGGYWGPQIGFYGGINYGFGYGGVGFGGGEWRGGAFFYNRAVMNVNVVNVRNVYSRTVIVNNVHTSFNGPGGIEARPSPQEEAYGRERHIEALSEQREHERAASQNRALFASENHGRPEIAATARPGEFSGRNVERARAGEPYHAPRISPQEARAAGGNRGSNESARNEPARNEAARTGNRSSDRPVSRSDNHETQNREPSSHENAKPARQEKQAQRKSTPPAKPEEKHGKGEEHR